MHISFLKEKKKKWNGIVAMALSKLEGKKKFCNWFVAMPLPKWGVKKKIGVVKSGMEFGNAIATIPFHIFFNYFFYYYFFKK